MVDVAEKGETRRIARAAGSVFMQPATLALIESGDARKGDVLGWRASPPSRPPSAPRT
jgi:cyclic pyranopterin phosphate synthase